MKAGDMNIKNLKMVGVVIFFILPAVGYAQPNNNGTSPDLLYHQKALQGIADNLLCLFDNMPRVRVVIREHEKFRKKTVRAFFSSNFEGQPTIVVNPKWVRKASYLKMENT